MTALKERMNPLYHNPVDSPIQVVYNLGMSNPIDVVITWVDGSDKAWRDKREHYAHESLIDSTSVSNVERRYRDNNDLRYLLRSLERYWQPNGLIYLVTDQQIPDFLSDNPRIRIIHHSAILPSENLPTFSSRAIESCLHKIPDISEQYVYINDGLMLTRSVSENDFFKDGKICVYLEPNRRINGGAFWNTANAKAIAWAAAKTGINTSWTSLGHAPRAFIRSKIEAFENRNHELFQKCRAAKFRRGGIISPSMSLWPYWCLDTDSAISIYGHCLYLTTTAVESGNCPRWESILEKRLCVCFNDTAGDQKGVSVRWQALEAYRQTAFPEPSQYEKSNN